MGVYKNLIEPFLMNAQRADLDLNPALGVQLAPGTQLVESLTEQAGGLVLAAYSAAYRPTLGTLNGHPSLLFAGAQGLWRSISEFMAFPEARTTFVVGNVTGGTNGTFYTRGGGHRWGMLKEGAPLHSFAQKTTGLQYNSLPYSSALSVFTQQIAHAPLSPHTFRRNGSGQTIASADARSENFNSPFTVGFFMTSVTPVGGYGLIGNILRIISYPFALTQEQIQEKEAELAAHYNITF